MRGNRLLAADFALIAGSVMGSFGLRLNLEQLFLDYLPALFTMLLVALIVKPLIYRRMGLYQRVWAYASIEEMKLIIKAVSAASLVVSISMLLLFFVGLFSGFPRSVLVIDWLGSLAAVGALRFSFRLIAEKDALVPTPSLPRPRRILLVGAGSAGALFLRELQKNPQLAVEPIAVLDDDPEKIGQKIHGVPVVAGLNDLPNQVEQLRVEEVIVAVPSAPGSLIRKIAELCMQANVPFRTMPGIYELIGGTVKVNRLREVDITDLLRRKPAQIDRKRVGSSINNKRVFVTGAGGSIASELCRQVARWGPSQLILLGHGENSIFEIFMELHIEFPDLDIQPIIADIRDKERMDHVVDTFKPHVIFHAAAHKHVPLMQGNPSEAITNNVLGTRNVLDAAEKHDVQQLVMISSDKAVNPSSVMGATKRIAEWVVLDAAKRAKRDFCVVRFGNVLGSRGSVIPLFKRQIMLGGPITVTHPDMERYFMTIPEAVHLVLQASSLGDRGHTYILDMGEPVRLADMAADLVRLSGLKPGEDIEIVYTGLRPGEKLSEELIEPGAEYEATIHPDIQRVLETPHLATKQLRDGIDRLEKLAQAGKADAILAELESMVPGCNFKPLQQTYDD
ncbi:MAG: polysaccharide biosynthesis protein [Chloroflexi bacterium]|nr:polysaccharide biosynthesis protein [Chloroflexota bacterium]